MKAIKENIVIITFGLLVILVMLGVINFTADFDDNAKRCDDLKGRQCSYYEIQQYSRGIR